MLLTVLLCPSLSRMGLDSVAQALLLRVLEFLKRLIGAAVPKFKLPRAGVEGKSLARVDKRDGGGHMSKIQGN